MKLLFTAACFLVLSKYLEAVFVDPQYKLIKWSGWGTALGWTSHLYETENEILREEIYDAIFSPERLNLNVVRYTIWGTSPEDTACESVCTHCKRESFRDSINSPFLWSRDSIDRKVLQRAKALGVDTFEAVASSPPSWMTRTKCASGNPDGAPLHDNFDPINSNAFADYLTEVIKHYHKEYNITFSSISPFYRPSSGEFIGGGREGCNMERDTMVHVIKSFSDAIKVKNLTFCSISAADDDGVNDAILTEAKLNEHNDIVALYTKVNVQRHKISDQDKPAELSTLADKYGRIIWCSEKMVTGTMLPNMSSGWNLAVQIVSDIRQLVPSVWVYWLAIDWAGYSSLLQVPTQNPSIDTLEMTSSYYSMMQFSKYIRKDFTIVHISDTNSVAAYDENSNILVIVTVNPSTSSVTKSFDLSAFSTLGQVSAFRTSSNEPHVVVSPPTITNQQIIFEFPAESVTTLRIVNAVAHSRTNLVLNGDFEEVYNGTSNPWSLAFGTRPDNGVNDKYSYRGKYSGNLDLNDSMLTLMQTVIVNVSRTYHLSAWCSTTGVDNTLFGILVNGMQGPEITIQHDKGYQLYGLSVNATESDVLSIYLRSERGNHTAQIDNVMLH